MSEVVQSSGSKHPPECKNPVLYSWIHDWYKEAIAQQSKYSYALKKCLNFLSKHPDVIKNESEALKIPGMGPTTVRKVKERMQKEYGVVRVEFPDVDESQVSENAAASNIEGSSNANQEIQPQKKRKSKTSSKAYVPGYQSGAFAILIGLLEIELKRGPVLVSRTELVKVAEKYSRSSFTVATAGSFYTAWSSMKSLVDKGLVDVMGNPGKYSLSDDGKALAQKLWKANQSAAIANSTSKSINSIPSSQTSLPGSQKSVAPSSSAAMEKDLTEDIILLDDSDDNDDYLDSEAYIEKHVTNSSFNPRIIPSNSYEIQMLIDNRERPNRSGQQYADFRDDLGKLGIKAEVLPLEVGDFCWVAKVNGSDNECDWVHLDYIVERKRLDDLLSSIKSGRLFNQKIRLETLGLGNCIFIIEKFNLSYGELDNYKSHIRTTKIRSQVSENFVVHETDSYQDTLKLLLRLHNLILRFYAGKSIYVFPANIVESETFSELRAKANTNFPDHRVHLDMVTVRSLSAKSQNLTHRDIFLKQLTRIRGVSAAKAIGIAEKYPTLRSLHEAYHSCASPEYQKQMLSGICGIGASLSNRIYQFFCQDKAYDKS